jgi:hypothetical protein
VCDIQAESRDIDATTHAGRTGTPGGYRSGTYRSTRPCSARGFLVVTHFPDEEDERPRVSASERGSWERPRSCIRRATRAHSYRRPASFIASMIRHSVLLVVGWSSRFCTASASPSTTSSRPGRYCASDSSVGGSASSQSLPNRSPPRSRTGGPRSRPPTAAYRCLRADGVAPAASRRTARHPAHAALLGRSGSSRTLRRADNADDASSSLNARRAASKAPTSATSPLPSACRASTAISAVTSRPAGSRCGGGACRDRDPVTVHQRVPGSSSGAGVRWSEARRRSAGGPRASGETPSTRNRLQCRNLRSRIGVRSARWLTVRTFAAPGLRAWRQPCPHPS